MRSAPIVAAAVALMAFAAVAPAPANAAPDPGPTGGAVSLGDIAHARTLRQEFGLPSDSGMVSRLATDESLDTSELGIPLTSAETVELRRRDDVARRAGIEGARLAEDAPQNFAGVWIDQRQGGTVHVLARDVRALAPLVGQELGSQVVVDPATFSLARLGDDQAALSSLMVKHEQIGRYATQASVEVPSNTVRLVVAADTPDSVVAAARKQFPTASIERTADSWTAQSRNKTSGPLYGGEWINASSGVGGHCTAGYSNARVGDRLVTLTAGHCSSGPWYQGYSSHATLLGGTISSSFSPGGSSNCDCKAIGRLPSSRVTSSVLTSDTATYYYSATSSSYSTGTRLCLSGAAYGDAHGGGIACGSITSSAATISYRDGGDFTLTDAVITNITGSLGGDSGGPYGSGRAFMGLHAAGYGNGSYTVQTALSKARNLGRISVSLRY